MRSRYKTHILVFAGAMTLGACGGGEEGTGITPQSPTPDVVVGTITAFGSIWVNGIEFDIEKSSVIVDGTLSTPTDLRLGMVVTVEGKINSDNVSGTADSVWVEEALRGPVSAVTANAITVLGQTVYINAKTFWDNFTDVNQLIGTDVEISGYTRSSGSLSATRIERLSQPTVQTKVSGTIEALNNVVKTFEIGALVVNFKNVLNVPVIANGNLVDIEGTLNSLTGQLDAHSIEIRTVPISNATKFEYEGTVTLAFDTKTGELGVDGLRVRTSTNTTFSGLKANELLLGVHVEVEGSLVNGVVQAKNIESHAESPTGTVIPTDD